MMDERNLEAVAEELLPDEEEIEREIKAEWERKYERGESIRAGDASKAVYERWLRKFGLGFFATLWRKGWLYNED